MNLQREKEMLSQDGVDMSENLESVTLADGVESFFLNYMHRSNLEPGDALPREEQLAAELNVSRHIVREGISRLKGLDLVESRQRRGMVMKRPCPFVSLGKLARAQLLTQGERRDLIEIRVALELGLSHFMYLRKTDGKIDELFSLAGSPDICHYGIEQEVDFHDKLFGLSGNCMAEEFHKILVSVFSPVYSSQHLKNTGKTPSHYRICEVLKNGTAEEFHHVLWCHLKPYLIELS